MTMIRKQIRIKPHQAAKIRRLAELRGTSEAEVIRQAVDQQISAETAHALPLDPQAWQEARRFMLELRVDESHATRDGIDKREDLYADRMRHQTKT
jgi:hypothetical protein